MTGTTGMTGASAATAGARPARGRALIRCEAVGRTYGTGDRAVVALYDASGAVAAGDRIAVVGPSGSGKSTLVHLLAGLDRPTAGRVEWPDLGGSPRDPHRIGVVFQAPSLLPGLSAQENVELPLLLADAPGAMSAAARTAAENALRLLGLWSIRGHLPQELSGGQAQRVVIARTLACRPAVILADEPTSQLDRTNADRVTDVLLEAADELCAALVVATHDPAIAERLDLRWSVTDGRLSTSGELR